MPHPVPNRSGGFNCSNYHTDSRCFKDYPTRAATLRHIRVAHGTPSHALNTAISSMVSKRRSNKPSSSSSRTPFNGQLERTSNSRGDTTTTARQGNQVVGSMKSHLGRDSRGRPTVDVSNVENRRPKHFSGVGRRLMNDAEKQAHSQGRRVVQTENTAPSAQPFYKKLGYQPDPHMKEQLKKAVDGDPNATEEDRSEARIDKATSQWRKVCQSKDWGDRSSSDDDR